MSLIFFYSIIYKSPVIFSCANSIYGEHLSESSMLKRKKIKCLKCSQSFSVKDCIYMSNNR